MKLTNKYNLPAPLVSAIEAQEQLYADSHDKPSDISATSLIDPPQIVELKRRHSGEIEQDASDMLYMLYGSIIHYILEGHCDPSTEMVEQRLYADSAGWIVSGQMDRFVISEGRLEDWKMCSVWEHMNGLKPERERQLNVLAWLLRRNGYTVSSCWINPLYRDWSKAKAGKDGYPIVGAEPVQAQLWSMDQQEGYVEQRVKLHQSVREGGADIPCTPEEKWEKVEYAVMKEGRKSAVRLHKASAYPSVAEAFDGAVAHAEALGANHYVEDRTETFARCRKGYCAVAPFCPQYAAYRE